MDQSQTLIQDPLNNLGSRHNVSIALYLITTILTCGLFNLYWNYRQMAACNDLLKRVEFKFGIWLLLVIVTCGIYHIFYQYKMGSAIVEIQQNNDRPTFKELPLVSILITVFGLSVVADCIHQYEINKLVS